MTNSFDDEMKRLREASEAAASRLERKKNAEDLNAPFVRKKETLKI